MNEIEHTYLDFVENRHGIWVSRYLGEDAPWADDPILVANKFTNVFRILDYGSQFLAVDLLEPALDERDTLMRAFLYRHTGKVASWKFFELMNGRYPICQDLVDGTLLETLKQYRGGGERKDRNSLNKKYNPREGATFQSFDRSVFTSAYLVFPQSQVRGTDKLESIVDLARRLFMTKDDIVPKFLKAKSQRDKFQVLHDNKGVGDFMSMQILTDWGYSQFGEDLENDFIVAGPGAVKGSAAIFPKMKAGAVIKWAHEQVQQLSVYITLPNSVIRRPTLMDVQNTLCEFSKYVRFMGKPLSNKSYSPAHPGKQSPPYLPEHWQH